MQQIDPVYSALGKLAGRPAASPTSVLHEDAALMANWTWESAAASSSQHASPLRSSPLRSSCSQSSDPAMPQQHQEPQQLASLPGGSASAAATSSATSRSLVETLQTCLTAMPPAHAVTASDLPQSRSGGTLSGGSSHLGPKKPAKRRSRASRRTPTQVLETDPSAFRDLVQRLTGLPTATAAAAAPMRPQPQRVSPGVTGMRPPAPSALGPNYPLLNSLLGRAGPPIDHSSSHIAFLQRLQQSTPGCEVPAPPQFTHPFSNPFNNPMAMANPFLTNDMAGNPIANSLFANPFIKNEDEGSGMPAPIQGSQPMQPWLQVNAAPNPPFSMSRHDQEGLGNVEIDVAISEAPSDVISIPREVMFEPARGTSGGQASQEEQEFSISQIDAWFMSSQDQMR